MKKVKAVISALLCVLLLASTGVFAFAQGYELIYESAYDSDTNTVSVAVYAANAAGLESLDLTFNFNEDEYEYIDCAQNETLGGDCIIVAGKPPKESHCCTASLMFIEQCEDKHLDEQGRLYIVTFNFRPLAEEPNLDNFYASFNSFAAQGADVAGDIAAKGNEDVHELYVEANPTTASPEVETGGAGSSPTGIASGSKWYIYVIAGVLAVGAIAAIAFAAVRSGKKKDARGEESEKGEQGKQSPENESGDETQSGKSDNNASDSGKSEE